MTRRGWCTMTAALNLLGAALTLAPASTAKTIGCSEPAFEAEIKRINECSSTSAGTCGGGTCSGGGRSGRGCATSADCDCTASGSCVANACVGGANAGAYCDDGLDCGGRDVTFGGPTCAAACDPGSEEGVCSARVNGALVECTNYGGSCAGGAGTCVKVEVPAPCILFRETPTVAIGSGAACSGEECICNNEMVYAHKPCSREGAVGLPECGPNVRCVVNPYSCQATVGQPSQPHCDRDGTTGTQRIDVSDVTISGRVGEKNLTVRSEPRCNRYGPSGNTGAQRKRPLGDWGFSHQQQGDSFVASNAANTRYKHLRVEYFHNWDITAYASTAQSKATVDDVAVWWVCDDVGYDYGRGGNVIRNSQIVGSANKVAILGGDQSLCSGCSYHWSLDNVDIVNSYLGLHSTGGVHSWNDIDLRWDPSLYDPDSPAGKMVVNNHTAIQAHPAHTTPRIRITNSRIQGSRFGSIFALDPGDPAEVWISNSVFYDQPGAGSQASPVQLVVNGASKVRVERSIFLRTGADSGPTGGGGGQCADDGTRHNGAVVVCDDGRLDMGSDPTLTVSVLGSTASSSGGNVFMLNNCEEGDLVYYDCGANCSDSTVDASGNYWRNSCACPGGSCTLGTCLGGSRHGQRCAATTASPMTRGVTSRILSALPLAGPVPNYCGNGVVEGRCLEDSTKWCGVGLATSCQLGCVYSEECDDANSISGDGCSATCRREGGGGPGCGNGQRESGEACDDGVLNSDLLPNACRTNCTLPGCGDRVIDDGEDCDLGDEAALCDADCTFVACGDGRVNSAAGESCDDGNRTSGDGCSGSCTVEGAPGASVLTNGGFDGTTAGWSFYTNGAASFSAATGEARVSIAAPGTLVQLYQPGIALAGARRYQLAFDCRATPAERPMRLAIIQDVAPYSGYTENGFVSFVCAPADSHHVFGLTTTPGSKADARLQLLLGDNDVAGDVYAFDDVSLIALSVAARCGDGVLEANLEQCDDGNTAAGDGCSASCTLETFGFCGDGLRDPGEACDAGEQNSDAANAACRSDCTIRRCGDDIVDPAFAEQCDDGAANSDSLPNACRTNCVLPRCGDRVVDAGEGCDAGGATSSCDADCTPRVCGDGTVNTVAGEECDDGNTRDFDGCTSTCRREATAAMLWMSFRGSTSVPGVGTVQNEDIVAYDTVNRQWSLVLDGSDVGLEKLVIDALAVLPSGEILLSFSGDGDVPGLIGGPSGNKVEDCDIVRFVPTRLGASSSGSVHFHFDGSDVGFDRSDEDIDALSLMPDGRLLLSVVGPASVNGMTWADTDLILFNANSLGGLTNGWYTRYFDGSAVGLTDKSNEDVAGASLDGTGRLLIVTWGDSEVSGARGTAHTVLSYDGVTRRWGVNLELTQVGVSSSAQIGSIEVIPAQAAPLIDPGVLEDDGVEAQDYEESEATDGSEFDAGAVHTIEEEGPGLDPVDAGEDDGTTSFPPE